MEEARNSGYYDLADSYQTSITQGEGEVKVLQQILEKLLKVKEAHDQDKDNQSVRAHQLDVQEFEQAQRKQMESFRQGLQQKKDLLDAFHTMSKETEVKYWDDIIATGKAKRENLKERKGHSGQGLVETCRRERQRPMQTDLGQRKHHFQQRQRYCEFSVFCRVRDLQQHRGGP